MHSPGKDDKLLVQDEPLEIGRDGMPQEIWDDMVKNERFIYVSLMFLNGSVLWAYYSCLSAQNFYTERFSESDLDFSFLTTLCTAWPMVIGQGVQMVFGLDKKISQAFRVHVGYAIFMAMSILIMVFSAIHFDNQNVGAALVLVCFGLIGFGNSLSEATYYTFSALFPIPKFTNGVQIGNTIAGIMNITIATIIRLAVGGVHQTKSSTNLSFYLFFGLLCIVLVVALALYRYLITLPSVKFLMDRNEQSAKDEGLDTQSVGATLANLWRILKIIWVPAAAQFIIFFVSLAVFPGFGCTASRNLFPPYMTGDNSLTNSWYCSPGIIGSYNYGDFFGRVLCTAAVYKVVSMNLALGLSVLRLAFIPLLLMGVAGTSLYSFPDGSFGALAFNISLNFLIGISTGLLATVTIGKAPRMLKPEDRESGGALMVFFLFFGIAAGSTFGFLVSENGWLGL